MNQERKYAKMLAVARTSSSQREPVINAQTMAKAATPLGATSLVKHVSLFVDWLYVVALLVAIFKDLTDYIGLGSLPAIGTTITICVSITIGFLMLMAGANEKRKLVKGAMKRLLALIGGTLVEAIGFGINFLPIETITVVVIYWLVLVDRKTAAEDEQKRRASGMN